MLSRNLRCIYGVLLAVSGIMLTVPAKAQNRMAPASERPLGAIPPNLRSPTEGAAPLNPRQNIDSPQVQPPQRRGVKKNPRPPRNKLRID